jgi:acyl carrier protein
MPLPEPVLAYLNETSRAAGSAAPQPADDLFKLGVLDSFALVDFLMILEESCGIKVPDSDVNAANFQTIEAIEQYVQQHRG